jgi:tetratricopeptide (TPR) repeat protein
LGKLGGSGASDDWNLKSSYYQNLRTQYQNAANKQIEDKNFKKAAYIYAHLLSDFYSAANVLIQGKCFREAAILYKKHLKNIPRAAECLENGGLLLEAIDLYTELKQYEKSGDLYKKLDQKENAEKQYLYCIENSIQAKDYLEAARLFERKMEDEEKSREMLLQGWENSIKDEICLENYLKSVEKTGKNISQEVNYIFEHKTIPSKRKSLLNVLSRKRKENSTPEFQQKTNEIAFKIISEEVKNGDLGILNRLKDFITTDPLISSDSQKYITITKKKTNEKHSIKNLQLDISINWTYATTFKDQFLVFGIKNNCLQLARSNWSGYVEYHRWDEPLQGNYYHLSAEVGFQNQIFVKFRQPVNLKKLHLLQNQYFEEGITIDFIHHQHNEFSVFTSKNERTVVQINQKSTSLQFYTNETLVKTLDCTFKDSSPVVFYEQINFSQNLVYSDNHYCLVSDTGVYLIFADGLTKQIIAQENVQHLLLGLVGAFYKVLRFISISLKGFCILNSETNEISKYDWTFNDNKNIKTALLLSDNRLLLASDKQVFMCDIEKKNRFQDFTITTSYPILAILNTYKRDEIGIVTITGEITTYMIPK